MSRIARIHALRDRAAGLLGWLESPLLLALRLFWGWQFAITGWGKLQHVDRVAAWFAELGIPAPTLNVYLAGGTELFGGILLFLGLGTRLAAAPLIVTMCVAYATSDREALAAIFVDPDKFVTAAPFLFLLASVVVFVYGPGALSLDRLIHHGTRPAPAETETGRRAA